MTLSTGIMLRSLRYSFLQRHRTLRLAERTEDSNQLSLVQAKSGLLRCFTFCLWGGRLSGGHTKSAFLYLPGDLNLLSPCVVSFSL